MVDKIELTKEQKREWQTYSKILRWYSTHLIKLSLIEVEALKRYHFRQPLPIPGNGIERYRIEGLFEYSTFINIILDPDYSKNCIEKVEAVPGKGNCASRWPVYANSIFKETSFEVFAGCTEKVLNCLVKNRHDNAEMWNVGFGPWVHDLITDCTEWLKHGGYRQYPIVPLIPVMFESFIGRISPENYTEKRFSRQIDLYSGIFNFQDPEDLPPEQSSYYYFASHAQHYLCKEATLPEALEQYIIKTTGLNVERLSDHECLPILPRPACYDEVPPIVKPSAKSAKAQEIYDETYPASDDDYPYPPLRYYGQGEVEGKTTLETVLDIFKTHKFYARKPKIKQEDPIHYLSLEWLENPPAVDKAWMCQFKPHPRFSMSEALELVITLIASEAALPIHIGDYDMDEELGPVGISTTEAKANLILHIEQPNREELPDDSSLMKNTHQFIKEIKASIGISLQQGTQAEELSSP